MCQPPAPESKISVMSSEPLDRLIEPFVDCLSVEGAQKLVSRRPDPARQARIDELADKSNRGTLTKEERLEYQNYVAEFHLAGIMQALARRRLRS